MPWNGTIVSMKQFRFIERSSIRMGTSRLASASLPPYSTKEIVGQRYVKYGPSQLSMLDRKGSWSDCLRRLLAILGPEWTLGTTSIRIRTTITTADIGRVTQSQPA